MTAIATTMVDGDPTFRRMAAEWTLEAMKKAVDPQSVMMRDMTVNEFLLFMDGVGFAMNSGGKTFIEVMEDLTKTFTAAIEAIS